MSQYCTEDQFVFDDAQDDFGFADSISGPLPISMGGTGAESAAGALQNLLLPLPVSDDPLDEGARVPYLAAGSPMTPQARRAEDLAGDLWTMLPKDAEPTEGSENAVTSGAVAEATAAVQEDLDEKLLAAYVTDTASGAIASFSDGADGVPIKALSINVEPVQTGTGDPSPQNVRPISGWDSVQLVVTGENLADGLTIESGYYNASGTPVSSSSLKRTPDYIPCQTGAQYCIAGKFTTANSRIRVHEYDADQTWLRQVSASDNIPAGAKKSVVWTASADAAYFRFSVPLYEDLLVGQVSTDETIQLGQTVYGGTLDVTGKKLTIDRAIVDLGAATEWGLSSNGNYFYSSTVASAIKRPASLDTTANILCTTMTSTTGNKVNATIGNLIGIATNGNVRCRFDGMPTTVDEFKAAVSGIMLCYELATPIEIDLSDIPEIATLYGDNCIWSDAGDVDVEYRADTALYIQKLTGSTEDDMIADANIPTNTYFMIGNTLYLSTAAIAQGETIVPGTNCTQTNLAAALNALNT